MNPSSEYASFVETGISILHRGKEYDILNPAPEETRTDSKYILRSKPKRGTPRYFALMRNVPNPSILFGVSLDNERFGLLPGWFSDKSGQLKSIS